MLPSQSSSFQQNVHFTQGNKGGLEVQANVLGLDMQSLFRMLSVPVNAGGPMLRDLLAILPYWEEWAVAPCVW